MKLAAALIESLWGIALPVEQLAPLVGHCGHACVELLLRPWR